jgi:hypothetical protein
MAVQELYGVVEFAFAAHPTAGDPDRGPGPRATFTAPSDQSFQVCAFRGGADSWKVRFSPGETGRWTWSLAPAATETAPASGTFDVMPTTSASPWRRHGPLTLHPSQRAFAHADGTPVFWLADTVWSAPAHAGLDEWDSYIARRSAQGFNVAQINALPQWDASGPPMRRPFLTRRGVEDVTQPDPAYFDTLDLMVARAADAGLIPAIVVLWFDNTPDDNMDWGLNVPRRGPFTAEAAQALARHLVARYEAYGATWFISGDTGFAAPGAVALYDAAAAAVTAASARPPLISAHLNGGTVPSAALTGRDWLDYIIFQSCHFSDSPDRARRYALASRALEPPRPVLNSEPCYDRLRIMGATNPGDERFGRDAVRRTSWISVLAGASAGISYGAHGLWPWHRTGQAYGPMQYGLPPDWREALALESGEDLARLGRFIRHLPWWDIAPAPGLAADPPEAILATATAGPGTMLAYVQGNAEVTLPRLGPDARAEWHDPLTGATLAATLAPGSQPPRIVSPFGAGDAVLLLRGV